MSVAPWISVSPASNPAAELGNLPFALGSVALPVPPSVVPRDATGILVFSWAILRGVNATAAYWHLSVASADCGPINWFSLLIAGDPAGSSVTCNSQAFWLPMPVDGNVVATLYANDLPSALNSGKVEIHGYMPARTVP